MQVYSSLYLDGTDMIILIIYKASANIDKIKGENEGARFGAALAAADLNGDGIDELIVGAPLYSSKVIL